MVLEEINQFFCNFGTRLDANLDRVFAGRGPGLSGAEPHSSRSVLCAAPGPATIQTVVDGVGIRQIFPDRTLLPR